MTTDWPSRPAQFLLGVLLLGALATGGCTFDVGVAPAACVQGDQKSCTCPGGTESGTMRCEDSIWGACGPCSGESEDVVGGEDVAAFEDVPTLPDTADDIDVASSKDVPTLPDTADAIDVGADVPIDVPADVSNDIGDLSDSADLTGDDAGGEDLSPDIGDLCAEPDRCDDGDECTVDSCDPSTGACGHEAVADDCGELECGASPSGCYDCGDCGGGFTCQEGACEAEIPDCNPAECPELEGYQASCNAQHYCEYAPNVASVWRAWDVWILVPAGSFAMGAPDDGDDASAEPRHDVSFADGYFVAKYETTAAAYADFLDSRGSADCRLEHERMERPCLSGETDGATVSWDDGAGSAVLPSTCQQSADGGTGEPCNEHPAVAMTWHGAISYCEFRSGRLCSEAEWERAARGLDLRDHPWGAASVAADLANCAEGQCADGWSGLAPVGSFADGVSPVGALDMAGNAAEMVQDDWHSNYDDIARPDDGSAWMDTPPTRYRVLRGGSWNSPAAQLRTWDRTSVHIDDPGTPLDKGFRCCRDSDPEAYAEASFAGSFPGSGAIGLRGDDCTGGTTYDALEVFREGDASPALLASFDEGVPAGWTNDGFVAVDGGVSGADATSELYTDATYDPGLRLTVRATSSSACSCGEATVSLLRMTDGSRYDVTLRCGDEAECAGVGLTRVDGAGASTALGWEAAEALPCGVPYRLRIDWHETFIDVAIFPGGE